MYTCMYKYRKLKFRASTKFVNKKRLDTIADLQQLANPRVSMMLITCTSPHPPPHMGPGLVKSAFQPCGWSTGQHSKFTCPVYISTYLVVPLINQYTPNHSTLLYLQLSVSVWCWSVQQSLYLQVPPQIFRFHENMGKSQKC